MPASPWVGTSDQQVTQGFGVCELAGDCPHTGIDIAAVSGTPIVDQLEGIVQDLTGGPFGLHQVLDIGGGRTILLGHELGFAVPSGTRVKKGDVLGWIGSSGFSTGSHLHFELDAGGRPVDPSSLLFGMGGDAGGLLGPGGPLSGGLLGLATGAGQAASGALTSAAATGLGLGALAQAVEDLPRSIGHGLADFGSSLAHNTEVWLQRQIVALAVAAAVLLVLFLG